MKKATVLLPCLAAVALLALTRQSLLGTAQVGMPQVSFVAMIEGASNLATDKNGRIYVLSTKLNSITVLDPDGTVERTIGPTIGRYKLRFDIISPIHVDRNGFIYVYSGSYLLILDSDGTLINIDDDGVILPGFKTGRREWIGTNRNDEIYILSASGDHLVEVLDYQGTRLRKWGNRVFTSGYVHVLLAMDSEDNLYSFIDVIPVMMKYDRQGNLVDYIRLRLPDPVEEHMAMSNLPLEKALSLDSLREIDPTGLPYPVYRVFFDVDVLSSDKLVATSNGMHFLWYTKSGDFIEDVSFIGNAGKGARFQNWRPFCTFATLPGGESLVAIDQTGAVIKVVF